MKIIVADYEYDNGVKRTCLVYATGSQEILDRIKNNPTKDDLYILGRGKNVRIEEDNKPAWWEVYGTN